MAARAPSVTVAANYTATAAWSAIDARQLDRAQGFLDRALYLAGMAKDPIAELRVWNSHAMLAHQRDEFTHAVDAGFAAQATAIARRDPFYASLAHARTAVAHSNLGDRQAALRSLGYAQEAMTKSTMREPRPGWVTSYGRPSCTPLPPSSGTGSRAGRCRRPRVGRPLPHRMGPTVTDDGLDIRHFAHEDLP